MAETAKQSKMYPVLNGINLPGKGGKEVRLEVGDELDAAQVKPKQLEWLLSVGAIGEPA